MSPATRVDPARAYEYCETLTRRAARNFSYGIRLLPRQKRQALSAVYAAARRIDDIGDGPLPVAEKLTRLDQIRRQLHRLPATDGTDPVLVALADAAERLSLPLGAFDELIDGCVADVTGKRYDTPEALIWYCRCVAGSIGRLSLAVFGTTGDGPASELADSLGIALQLTNILRDLREDAAVGRRYLPRTDLERYGCTLRPRADGSGFVDPPERLAELIRYEASRARHWYAAGWRLLPLLDRRSAGCAAAMAGIYRRLLTRIEADPLTVTYGRISLPAREKAWVAARALAGWSGS